MEEVLEETPCPGLKKGFVPKARNIPSTAFDDPMKLLDIVYGEFYKLLVEQTNINYKKKFPRGNSITVEEIIRYHGMKIFEANHWNHKRKARDWWTDVFNNPCMFKSSDLNFLSLNRFFIINQYIDAGVNEFIKVNG